MGNGLPRRGRGVERGTVSQMNSVIVRALREEAKRQDVALRQALASVGRLIEWNGGANQVGYDYPRGQVAKALQIIRDAAKRWDDVDAELRRAEAAVAAGVQDCTKEEPAD